MLKIGIIGGTGLDDPDIFQDRKEIEVNTIYGKPSDKLVTGTIKGVQCVLLARHGRKHHLMPSTVNYRANIEALCLQGCTHVIATTACGSLQEHIHPADVVIIDQFIDRTYKREPTFYDGKESSPKGICHMQMDQPFCEKMRSILIKAAKKVDLKCHEKGTVVTIEGPRFSSKAESNMFRSWSCDLVNMTTVPEVCLAKEAGLCYASIGLPTDYDCWKDEPVNVEMVIKTLKENGEHACKLILEAVSMITQEDWTEDLKEHKALVKISVMMP